jgi:cytochrome P450
MTTDYPVVEVDLVAKVAPATSHWQEIDELREKYRYFWSTVGQGYWVLTHYEDVREAFQSPEIFCNHSIVATDPDPQYRFLPSFIDPPEHMKYRKFMNRWFAPASVERFRPDLVRLAQETIDEFVDDGHCDFLETVGDWYPVKVFLTVMGLPLDLAPYFLSCVKRISGAISGLEDQSGALSGMADIDAYYREALAERRARQFDPDVDFVAHLMRSKIDDRPLDEKEILDLCMTLTLGSLDTMKSQLGWCFYHLATHPSDRRWVVEDPGIIPSAVEEFLRAYPIVSMARKATRDVDFHGCPIKKDDMVLLAQQAATRDPRIFPDADKVILDRSPNRHIAFGASEHRCLGSHLARAELRTSIEQWHLRIPEYHVDSDEPLLAHGGQVSLLGLPLAWAT